MDVTKWRCGAKLGDGCELVEIGGENKNRLANWDGCGSAGISVVWFNEYVSRWSAMGKAPKNKVNDTSVQLRSHS
jgi:hypothetical protein